MRGRPLRARTQELLVDRLWRRSRHWLPTILIFCSFFGLVAPTHAASLPITSRFPLDDTAVGPLIAPGGFRTNLTDYPDGRVPRYGRFEFAFDITDTTATNPYFPYTVTPPPGVEPGTGITVDALLLPPGQTNWSQARVLPCFTYQPVEEVGSGASIAFLPVGALEWRCRFTPDVVGTWRYRVRATDAQGTSESAEGNLECVMSAHKGFVGVSETDTRFFEFADGTPFVTPLVNLEEGSPFNTLEQIRTRIQQMGQNGIRFVRWFPTGEGTNYFVAPYADSMHINWQFGDGGITPVGVDVIAGKRFSYRPYFYSTQALLLLPNSRYRLSFRATVSGEQVLRAHVGALPDGTIDICSTTGTYHTENGETCMSRNNGWQDYSLIVETGSTATRATVAVRGLYVSTNAPAPYNQVQEGAVRLNSIRLQRDESGAGDWGGNLLTRSDPDTYAYIDQQAAARLDEIFHQSEMYGVYHKLTLFHKNDALLARFLPDGTAGAWNVDNFYSAEGQAARWYQEAYVRYFVARWSYSTALHSLELANENHFYDCALDAAFATAQTVRTLSPRHILMSNSFWGWWVSDFWLDSERGHLMDYSDKHWYANETGSYCDEHDANCDLISNVWDDSAAYVRECRQRFTEYREGYGYDKPIVRGEGGVAMASTEPQHPAIVQDPRGIYYHKKLWAHVGVLGSTCDGEWYPRLFVEDGGAFPNADHNLYGMFAAYERFVAGERLSNGNYVEIGSDLSDDRQIYLTNVVGELRAWGVQDAVSGRTLVWIDNAAHTWKTVVDDVAIAPAAGILTLSGLRPGKPYLVQWWDPYTGTRDIDTTALMTARLDGTLALELSELNGDVAVKVIPYQNHHNYLPLIIQNH